ncbi:MAG: TetR/AcrR family transcriptional regulator [Hyphomicrobiales bacterium]|nr:TetR/AcrR family transcriptional regulator [Hyphomicrobiales bacterium]
MAAPPHPRSTREKLLDAALATIRARGYAATTVEEICAAAGVTKGAFFHHFRNKEDLGVAAADHWSATTSDYFRTADFHRHADPLDRILGYVDLRRQLVRGALADFTCLVGTMAQEVYQSHPAIRDACGRSISAHAATLEADMEAAIAARAPDCNVTAKSLALHTQAVIQGAFILAKATGDVATAADQIDHLRRYLALLFSVPTGA